MSKQEGSHEEQSLKRKKYEKELKRLQGELCELQDRVKQNRTARVAASRGATPPARAVQFARLPSASAHASSA